MDPEKTSENVGHGWVIVVLNQLSNFSAISWQEQVNFQWDDEEDRFFTRSTHFSFWIFIVLAHWNINPWIDRVAPLWHYPDSEPISLCSFPLMLRTWQRSNKYQFHSHWFLLIGFWSTTPETIMLTFTPMMQFYVQDQDINVWHWNYEFYIVFWTLYLGHFSVKLIKISAFLILLFIGKMAKLVNMKIFFKNRSIKKTL